MFCLNISKQILPRYFNGENQALPVDLSSRTPPLRPHDSTCPRLIGPTCSSTAFYALVFIIVPISPLWVIKEVQYFEKTTRSVAARSP